MKLKAIQVTRWTKKNAFTKSTSAIKLEMGQLREKGVGTFGYLFATKIWFFGNLHVIKRVSSMKGLRRPPTSSPREIATSAVDKANMIIADPIMNGFTRRRDRNMYAQTQNRIQWIPREVSRHRIEQCGYVSAHRTRGLLPEIKGREWLLSWR